MWHPTVPSHVLIHGFPHEHGLHHQRHPPADGRREVLPLPGQIRAADASRRLPTGHTRVVDRSIAHPKFLITSILFIFVSGEGLSRPLLIYVALVLVPEYSTKIVASVCKLIEKDNGIMFEQPSTLKINVYSEVS